ncbi:hypothetical protein Celaphus_00010049 [Cervus elaphus hippelaphus]|uniref:MAGE domain-containing protein n=1 Tax=Cervus elaphus hippelaphus TaxID=46360 RepID=A0A212C0P5_CEREH|nr:hypothetical protein Celaphus_00010049 [Cervus elaphus hippelaphus]
MYVHFSPGVLGLDLFDVRPCPQLPSSPHARLWSLTCVIMPQKHKNKYHAHRKRHQGSPPSSPAAGNLQELQEAMAPSSPDAQSSCAGSDEGALGPEEESVGASQAALATQSTRKDPLTRKASMLVEFLLEKYTKKEPIRQNALLKVVSRKYRPALA